MNSSLALRLRSSKKFLVLHSRQKIGYNDAYLQKIGYAQHNLS